MDREFEGQIVAVTGAASGIGLETVKEFTQSGAKVVALDINGRRLEKLTAEVSKDGFNIVPMGLDITSENDVASCFAAIKEKFGRLDVLVNSAGIITFVKMDKLDSVTWDKVVNINMRGTFFCSREAAAIMKEQKSGAIINISAGAAKTGGINPSASYIASKGGINSLTFHFAAQLAPFGVRVNAICPGPIDTPMMDAQVSLPGIKGDGKSSVVKSVPLGLGYPEDIAYGVMFLASNVRARYITGEILDINGGLFMD
ncbi:MAG: SDR family NAD(P)-dependent oxidoreductase [Eubacteriales bacterium]|nr:SDR family NAD(P)-dependent oxidoreductase [Eubacteriales bacterium]